MLPLDLSLKCYEYSPKTLLWSKQLEKNPRIFLQNFSPKNGEDQKPVQVFNHVSPIFADQRKDGE